MIKYRPHKPDYSYPNPKTKNPIEYRRQRFFEILPGFLTWFTLLGMFFFSWLIPVWMAVFIIIFDIYWIYRTIYIATFSIMGYRKLKRWKRIDWRYRLRRIFEGETLVKELQEEIKDTKEELGNRNLSRKLKKQLI